MTILSTFTGTPLTYVTAIFGCRRLQTDSCDGMS